MRSYPSRSIRHLRQLLKGIRVGMFTTQTAAGETHSRPMLLQDIDDDGWLWFLTDRSSRKACELARNPSASITFQSPRGERYLSVQGTAVIVRDDVQIERLWHTTYRAWFPKGQQDPEIALIAVRVARAEYWLVPASCVIRAVAAIAAVATGRRFEARHGVLDVHPQPA